MNETTTSLYVTPVPGRSKVRDPRTMRHLPDEGLLVTADDSYWYRRQADGDVVIGPRPTPTPAKATPSKEQRTS